MPAKAKLTTRSTATTTVTSDNLAKGTELSFNEADSNFINLRDQSIAISDGVTTTDIEAGETITFSGASVSGNTVTITGGASLGDLTAVGSTLSAPSNANLRLQASGTGQVEVHDGLIVSLNGASNEGQGEVFRAQPGTGPEMTIDINHNGQPVNPSSKFSVYGSDGQSAGGNIPFQIVLADQANVKINGMKFPSSDGGNGQYLTTNGSGTLSWSTSTLTSFGDLTAVGSTIASPSNADLTLDPSGSGKVQINSNLSISGQLTVGNVTHSTGTLTRNDSNQDLTIQTSQTASTTGALQLQGSPSGYLRLKGPVEITFDTSDAIGSGNSLLISETFTRFNKGGNDTQNLMVHKNGTAGTSDAILHIETYRNMVTINDSGIAYNGGTGKFEGQGTENFNVIGTARLDNVYFKDNQIYTNRSNEDLQISTAGTGTVDFKLPTSSTIGANGSASALTANPVGYLKIKVNGTEYQIPYYNI